jgi:SAM-dependent methyltransferase
VHDRLPYRRCKKLLEVGSGVGAQTAILLRQFPELHVTGVELNDDQIAEARRFLGTVPWAFDRAMAPRWDIVKGDATQLDFAEGSFDAAFLCWILEHVRDPARVLSEVRRVLVPNSPIVCSEVLNATLFIDPYSPETLRYWTAFNEQQLESGGDPFVGAKLGNLLLAAGWRDVTTEAKTFHFDQRAPAERAEFLAYWTDLLLSAAPGLLEAGRVSQANVDAMGAELARIAGHPDSVLFYSFVQARARAQ